MVVFNMLWHEIRQNYPNQWVKLNILKNHIDGNKEFIDEMEIIKTIENDLEAGQELVKCKGNEVVFHTFHENIHLEIRNIFGFRAVK